MFETYENTLCVHGGWLYREAKVMSKVNYDNYVRRGPFQVLRKGFGRKPALIAWVSLPNKYRDEIIEKYGDPVDRSYGIKVMDFLERDPKAIEFYANYTLENGTAIPEDIQHRYAVEAAILGGARRLINDRILRTRTLGSGGLTKTWKSLAEIIHQLPRHTWPHSLPKNYRSLQRKYRAFVKHGYESLIHGGHGHKNSEKLCDKAKQWVLAQWAQHVQKVASLPQLLDQYNEYAIMEGLKAIKEEKTLYNYLYSPEIKSMWYGHRYGELKAKEKYSYQHSTSLPSMRDSLWYSDGTKLNLYFQDEKGKMSTCQVYEVMDAYSEVLLGYHVSPTEDFEAQYFAYKMAVKNAGHRPYEIRMDNQGGHKKLQAGNFLTKVSRLAIRTQPYNGKSKTIESAFGRFQSQVLKRLWYFTGQNITARAEESQANMEFILANAHNLPTLEEAIEAYVEARLEWNSRPHHKTGQPRLDMYHNSENPKAPEITLFEMVDIFWIERPKPVTCTAFGISFTEKGQKHTYMVYGEDRLPDLDFLQANVDRKFYIKYDPEDLSLIYLYEQTPMGLRFVSAAETKVTVSRGKQEQQDWESSYIAQIGNRIKEKRVERRDRMDEILETQGLLPEQNGLVSPHLKGIESKSRTKRNPEIGAHQKAVSNAETTQKSYRSIYQDF